LWAGSLPFRREKEPEASRLARFTLLRHPGSDPGLDPGELSGTYFYSGAK